VTDRLLGGLAAALPMIAMAIVAAALALHHEAVVRPPAIEPIDIMGTIVRAEVVKAPDVRTRGLSGRAALGRDTGMLFVFPRASRYGFWMKEMRFPIDILWLADDGRIVDLRESVSPDTYPTLFRPQHAVRYVLELPAGFAAAHGIRLGDVARF